MLSEDNETPWSLADQERNQTPGKSGCHATGHIEGVIASNCQHIVRASMRPLGRQRAPGPIRVQQLGSASPQLRIIPQRASAGRQHSCQIDALPAKICTRSHGKKQSTNAETEWRHVSSVHD